jgi:hypothetical protein
MTLKRVTQSYVWWRVLRKEWGKRDNNKNRYTMRRMVLQYFSQCWPWNALRNRMCGGACCGRSGGIEIIINTIGWGACYYSISRNVDLETRYTIVCVVARVAEEWGKRDNNKRYTMRRMVLQYFSQCWPWNALRNRMCGGACCGRSGGREIIKKVNVYLPSLMMKVPNHLYVLGNTYTCHT